MEKDGEKGLKEIKWKKWKKRNRATFSNVFSDNCDQSQRWNLHYIHQAYDPRCLRSKVHRTAQHRVPLLAARALWLFCSGVWSQPTSTRNLEPDSLVCAEIYGENLVPEDFSWRIESDASWESFCRILHTTINPLSADSHQSVFPFRIQPVRASNINFPLLRSFAAKLANLEC